MFLKCTGNRPNDETVGYYKVVEAYRDKKNNPKHRILLNIGPLKHTKANILKNILEATKNPDIITASIDDIIVSSHKAYLDVMVLLHFLKKWGLDQLFVKFNYVVPMILNRCIDPISKIGVTRWVKKTVLPDYTFFNYEEADEYSIYRELEQLNQMETTIQKHLFNHMSKISSNNNTFFYDITSTYFEGTKCVLSKFGYSRDKRPDRKQIVIALLIDDNGYPFYWKVLPGNTQDITTIVDLANSISKNFGLKKCTLIFDRGMVSEDNLLELQKLKMHFVTAINRNQINGLNLFDLSYFNNLKMNEPIEKQLPGYKKYDNTLFFQEKKKGKDTLYHWF